MPRFRQLTDADLNPDTAVAARERREQRMYAVVEKLRAFGIDIDELIELIEERQNRSTNRG